MAWRVWSVDTATGARKGLLPVASGTWARALNASCSGAATVQLSDAIAGGVNVRQLTEPVRSTLVFEFNNVPIFAGIIWWREYQRDGGILHLRYTDLWSIFGRRLVAPWSSAGVEAQSVGWSNLSLGTHVKRAIQQATAGTGFILPIVLPADVAGTHGREYKGYHMPLARDVIEDLMNTQYGPDVDFLPEWAPDGNFRWRLLAGEPAEALLVWNLTARKDGAHSLTVTEDANSAANHVIASGEGTEVDRITRSAISGASLLPALVKTIQLPQEKNHGLVQAAADAELAANDKPTEQWSFHVKTGAEYDVTALRPGIGVRAYTQSDPWLTDGFRHLLLIRYDGDLSEDVKLEFQPTEVA